MKKNCLTSAVIMMCICFYGCSTNEELESSIIGSWNAVILTEEADYIEHNEKSERLRNDIEYGTYIWTFNNNGEIHIIGNDGGKYSWYNNGEKPTDYTNYIIDKQSNKLLFSFSDKSKNPIECTILNLSAEDMTLSNSARWLNVGDGEIKVTRTINFKRIE